MSDSRSVVSDSLQPHGVQPTSLLGPWNSSGKNTGVGCHFLGITPVHIRKKWLFDQMAYAGFGANMSFDFSGLNAQKCDRWVIWYV